jgi:hypothetical protein
VGGGRKSAWLLHRGLAAQKLIRRFSLQINHLHEDDASMTGSCLFSASVGAPVDVRSRMGTGFADG